MCGFCEIYMGVLGASYEIKRRGLLQQGSKVCGSGYMQMRPPYTPPKESHLGMEMTKLGTHTINYFN